MVGEGKGLTDPDAVGAVDGDGVAAPDVLRVELRDVDVLDDDVLCAVGDVQALAAEDAGGSRADDRLVGADGEAGDTGFVVCDLDGG